MFFITLSRTAYQNHRVTLFSLRFPSHFSTNFPHHIFLLFKFRYPFFGFPFFLPLHFIHSLLPSHSSYYRQSSLVITVLIKSGPFSSNGDPVKLFCDACQHLLIRWDIQMPAMRNPGTLINGITQKEVSLTQICKNIYARSDFLLWHIHLSMRICIFSPPTLDRSEFTS